MLHQPQLRALAALSAASLIGAMVALASSSSADKTVLYRVNAGGGSVDSPAWSADTESAPSQFLSGTTGVGSTTQPIDMSDPSVPRQAPMSVFQTERFALPSGNMDWHFPVAPGDYLVHLYFAETYPGTQAVGARVFDVSIEGQTVLFHYDVFKDVGGYKAVVKSFAVTSDSELNIDFSHVVENPAVKGIKIVRVTPTVPETSPSPMPSSSASPSPLTSPTPEPSASNSPVPTPTLPSTGGCNGVDVAPGASTIHAAVAAHGAGTTFCLRDGTYAITSPIVPKAGDSFIGVSSDGSRPIIDGGHRSTVKWDILADGVPGVGIANLQVLNAFGPGKAIDKQAGRGVWGGPGLRVTNSYFSGNMQSGVGGGGGGWLIVNSQFVRNGSAGYLGCCAGGVKSGSHYTVIGSLADANIGNGFWCDAGCEGGMWTVKNNIATNNGGAGIRYEMSTGGAVIQDNTVRTNNHLAKGLAGGIAVNSASNATVVSNTLGGNIGAGIIFGGSRIPLNNDKAIGNDLGGDELHGCGGGVVCTGNS